MELSSEDFKRFSHKSINDASLLISVKENLNVSAYNGIPDKCSLQICGKGLGKMVVMVRATIYNKYIYCTVLNNILGDILLCHAVP